MVHVIVYNDADLGRPILEQMVSYDTEVIPRIGDTLSWTKDGEVLKYEVTDVEHFIQKMDGDDKVSFQHVEILVEEL